MSLALAVVVVVAAAATIPPATSSVAVTRTRADTEVIKYLQRFGYLNNNNRNNSHRSITDVAVKEAISLFQEFYQIPGDGTLNNETLRQMLRPRCGMRDIPHFARDTGMNPWRKTHLTWNFQFADADTLTTAALAFHLWTLNSSLTFERKILDPDILISYQGGVHMFANHKRAGEICDDPFDGPNGILAHAYYPLNIANYVSEIHMDTAEPWHIRIEQNPPGTTHLLHTLTHEIGHSLGLPHSSRTDSIMFAFSPEITYPVRLGIEDVLRIQHWYGIKEEPPTTSQNPSLSTETKTTTTTTTRTTQEPVHIDLCDIQHVDSILILDHRVFVTYQRYVWPLDIDGDTKRIEEPLPLRDYMDFLPNTNFSLSAAYQRPSGEIVFFVNDMIYMINYPSFTLSDGWPKKLADIRLPKNAVINAAINTHKGRTYVIFDNDKVAEMDECSMTVRRFRSLQAIFPGIPSPLRLAFRNIDGNIYFANNSTVYKFNEFTNAVSSVGKFDLGILNVECQRDGLLQQLQDIVQFERNSVERMFALDNHDGGESQRSNRYVEDENATKGRKRGASSSNDTTTAIKIRGRGGSTIDNNERRLDTHNINTRILERRYPLTKTGYKYLNVGIDVKPPSRATIVLGDRQGKEISLSCDAWKKLVELKGTILSHLHDSNDDRKSETHVPPTIHIDTLKMCFGRINNLPIVRMETSTGRLTMSRSTVLNIFNLEYCVNRLVSALSAITDDVDKKLTRLTDVASTVAEPSNIMKTMYDKAFDSNDIVGCELIALLFGESS